jgi:hypothetical protein
VIHIKLRVILIIGLLTLAFVVPAAADRTDVMDTTYSQDLHGNPRAASLRFEKVVETDTSDVFSPFNFPPEKYKFISLYYTLFNPSGKDVNYEFNITIRDQANREFYTDVFILAEKVPSGGSLTRRKDFAVYRNSTNLQLVWYDKEVDPPWDHYYTYIPIEFADITPTPSATPAATVAPTPTPTPPAPAQGCMSYLPLGLIIGCVGGFGLWARKYRTGR